MSGIRMDKAMKTFIAKIISQGGLTYSEINAEEGELDLVHGLQHAGMISKPGFTGPKPIEPEMELYFAAIACGVVLVNYDIKVSDGAPALVDERTDGISSWNPASKAMFTHSIAFGLSSGRLILAHRGRNVYQVVEA